jgi:hypothetical protein
MIDFIIRTCGEVLSERNRVDACIDLCYDRLISRAREDFSFSGCLPRPIPAFLSSIFSLSFSLSFFLSFFFSFFFFFFLFLQSNFMKPKK